jgi:hypothetical protein
LEEGLLGIYIEEKVYYPFRISPPVVKVYFPEIPPVTSRTRVRLPIPCALNVRSSLHMIFSFLTTKKDAKNPTEKEKEAILYAKS